MNAARVTAFRCAAFALVCAAAYHCLGIMLPKLTTYSLDYPVWRHVLFVAIDVGFAWLLLLRPIWLIWPYTVLALQQLNSHGYPAWTAWRLEGRIAWIDILVVVSIVLIEWLLWADWRARRNESAPGRSL